jgi:hypothetical protein
VPETAKERTVPGFARVVLMTLAMAFAVGSARAYDAPPRIAHFATDDRTVGFVLDQTGPTARLRFDGETEVLAGWWRPAAGGDRILVRDDGVLTLRQNVAGGLTLFSARFPMGMPVNFDRPSMPLEGPPPPIETLRDSAREAAVQAASAFGVTIRFEGGWDAAADDAGLRAVLFESVQNASAALRMLAADAQARPSVARHLRVMRFKSGAKPGVSRDRSAAVIFFVMEPGVASRPSSYRIAREIKAQFR